MALAIGLVVWRVATRPESHSPSVDLMAAAMGTTGAAAGEGMDPAPYRDAIMAIEAQIYKAQPEFEELQSACMYLASKMGERHSMAGMKVSRQLIQMMQVQDPARLVRVWEDIRTAFKPADWFVNGPPR